ARLSSVATKLPAVMSKLSRCSAPAMCQALAAKAVTAALVFFFNYSLRKHLLFTRSAAVTRS
ncbi:hypothetical protein ABTL31_18365, partial [Acinetobacter baumannii]